jgi:hypothetical protein
LLDLETRLSGKKLVDFTPKQWESLFLAINASLAPNSGRMRADNSLVINTLKFYQCPDKKDSFTVIDQYFVNEHREDLDTWKAIRTRVFAYVYKNGSNAFTREELAFLDKHDLFDRTICPPPADLPRLMKKFCRELPEEMRKATDVFDIMAYVHQKVVHIHYFKDENGRTARILMGLIALQAGIQPVLFEGNRDYLRAAADPNPKSLAVLLRELSQRQLKSLNDARNPMIDTCLKGIMQSSYDR